MVLIVDKLIFFFTSDTTAVVIAGAINEEISFLETVK